MDVVGIYNAALSHLLASGLFEHVNGHESTSPPANRGLAADMWFRSIGPVPAASGLAATSGRIIFLIRIYASLLQEPKDGIDLQIIEALDVLMDAYSSDFTLGGRVRQVDLLGAHGVPLDADGGYLRPNEENPYRTATINLPLIVSDLWEQEP